MKLPSSIRLHGHAWKIRVVDQAHLDKVAGEYGEENEVVGYCTWAERAIYLSAELAGDLLLSTLIHEVIHAVSYTTGVKISHKAVYKIEEALGPLLWELLEPRRAARSPVGD